MRAQSQPVGLFLFKMWHVYICDRKGKLYTGITTDLENRMRQHDARLLYSETHPDRFQAAKREKQIKGWRRDKKIAPIGKVSLFPSRNGSFPQSLRHSVPPSAGCDVLGVRLRTTP